MFNSISLHDETNALDIRLGLIAENALEVVRQYKLIKHNTYSRFTTTNPSAPSAVDRSKCKDNFIENIYPKLALSNWCRKF